MPAKKKYTVSVTFSADKTYEVEADNESEALDEADFLATQELIGSLDVEFYAQAHYAKEGWDEEDEDEFPHEFATPGSFNIEEGLDDGENLTIELTDAQLEEKE